MFMLFTSWAFEPVNPIQEQTNRYKHRRWIHPRQSIKNQKQFLSPCMTEIQKEMFLCSLVFHFT
uniref:Uncharacterized protein n=1 Tax=Anguilla anguilla TaxID=7936 RepID=A0A0E9S0K3_ANGAN